MKYVTCELSQTPDKELGVRGKRQEWVVCPLGIWYREYRGQISTSTCKKCRYYLGEYETGPLSNTNQRKLQSIKKEPYKSKGIEEISSEVEMPTCKPQIIPEEDGIHIMTMGLPAEPEEISYKAGKLTLKGSGYKEGIVIDMGSDFDEKIHKENPIKGKFHNKGTLDVILRPADSEKYRIEWGRSVATIEEFLKKKDKEN